MPTPPPGFEIETPPPGFELEEEGPAPAQVERAKQWEQKAKLIKRESGIKVEKPEEEKGGTDYLNDLWDAYKKSVKMGVDIATAPMHPIESAKTAFEIGKAGLGMAMEGAALPVSGVAGLAKGVSTMLSDTESASPSEVFAKGMEAGGKTMEEIQQFATENKPKSEFMQAVGQGVEAGMQIPGVAPTVQTIMKTPEAIGDVSYNAALKMGLSPETATYFGTIGRSAIPVVIELLGVHGTKISKKGLLKKIMKTADKAEFYDEFGTLKKEVKTALDNAGIGLDEVADTLPESIVTQKGVKPLAEEIKGVPSKLGVGESGRMAKLAESFEPDIKKIEAFEKANVEYLPQYVSNNPSAKAIAENLKDIPGSMMAPQEKKIYQQLGEEADNIIKQGGGTIEKGELSSRYVTEAENVVDKLADKANVLYDKVSKQIPQNTQIQADNIVKTIDKLADDVNGIEYLGTDINKLYKALAADKNPTYGRLDMYRRQVGERLGKAMGDGPFAGADRKHLGELYDALTKDQEAVVKSIGGNDLLNTYKTAKGYVAQRKGIEKQLQTLLGKNLNRDVTKRMGTAIKQLAKGDYRSFDKVLENIPKELGKDMRRDLVVTALNDMFTAGARGQGKISIGGFGSYWKKLNRNKTSLKRLRQELGPDTWKRVQNFAKVNDALKETMELSVKTGRQISTPGLFDEVNGIFSRVYGVGAKKAGKIPGLGWIGDVARAPKNARAIAADELLTDKRFINLLKYEAQGKINTATKRANINKIINNIQGYKKWKKSLPEADLKKVNELGALGYFTSAQPEE